MFLVEGLQVSFLEGERENPYFYTFVLVFLTWLAGGDTFQLSKSAQPNTSQLSGFKNSSIDFAHKSRSSQFGQHLMGTARLCSTLCPPGSSKAAAGTT